VNAIAVCSSGTLVAVSEGNSIKLRVETDLRPGQSRRGEVTIVNVGPLPASMRLHEEEAASHPEDEAIAIAIDDLGGAVRQRVFLGRVGALPDAGIDLGRFLAGESRTYLFTVLRSQGVEARQFSARARYRWCAGQAGLAR
jgi:spore coat-associated protein N